jgi:hypothetical protein
MEQFKATLVEVGPFDRGRIKPEMRIDKKSTKEFFVFIGTNRERFRRPQLLSAILVILNSGHDQVKERERFVTPAGDHRAPQHPQPANLEAFIKI